MSKPIVNGIPSPFSSIFTACGGKGADTVESMLDSVLTQVKESGVLCGRVERASKVSITRPCD